MDSLLIGDGINLQLEDNSTLVEPTGEQRLSIKVRRQDGDKSVCDQILARMPDMDELREQYPRFHGAAWESVQKQGFPSSCVFYVRETSFNSKDRGERTFSVECKNISFMSACLEKRFAS